MIARKSLWLFETTIAFCLFVAFSTSVHGATLSNFSGPYELTESGEAEPVGPVYNRYDAKAGLVQFFLQTSRRDGEEYLPEDGEQWDLRLVEESTGNTVLAYSITYDAASDCYIGSNGSALGCGYYIPEEQFETRGLTVSLTLYLECINEVDHRLEVIMNNGSHAEGSPFVFSGSRFRPKIEVVGRDPSIIPEMPGDNYTTPGAP